MKRNSRCSDRNKYCALAKFEFLILSTVFFYFKSLCAAQEMEMGFEDSSGRVFSRKIVSTFNLLALVDLISIPSCGNAKRFAYVFLMFFRDVDDDVIYELSKQHYFPFTTY